MLTDPLLFFFFRTNTTLFYTTGHPKYIFCEIKSCNFEGTCGKQERHSIEKHSCCGYIERHSIAEVVETAAELVTAQGDDSDGRPRSKCMTFAERADSDLTACFHDSGGGAVHLRSELRIASTQTS
jgi:hypothetical protein